MENKILTVSGHVVMRLRTYLQVKVETDVLTPPASVKKMVQDLIDASGQFPNAHVSILRSNQADMNGATVSAHPFKPETSLGRERDSCMMCGRRKDVHIPSEPQLSDYTDKHNEAHQKA